MKERYENKIELFLESIYEVYGYDFRQYSKASLKRRIENFMINENIDSMEELIVNILESKDYFLKFVVDITVNTTTMFREPNFFLMIRKNIAPFLHTYPFIRVWCAGCSTGEEIYSIAILLKETGLYDKCRIYATDINDKVLQKAKDGIFPMAKMKEYTRNYIASGGTQTFSEYYLSSKHNVIFNPELRKNIIFAENNLATDSIFNEFHLILCRNVMIYFDKTLQERVLENLHKSLEMFGFFGIGEKESLKFTNVEGKFEQIDEIEKLFRRIK